MKDLSQINNQPIKVYVELLDEGTESWRPTQAIELEDGLFKLLPTADYDPELESWAFLPDTVVRLEEKFSEGEFRKFVRHPNLEAVRIQMESTGGAFAIHTTCAVPLGDGRYKVLATPHYSPDQQFWKFLPGSIVRLEKRMLPYPGQFAAKT